MSSVRSFLLVRSLWMLLCCVALVGAVALAVGPASAGADEGEETTTTEEPPPVVELPPVVEVPPVEVELPTLPENPTTSPPGGSPPVSEAPTSEPTHSGGGGGSTTTNTGAASSGGGTFSQTDAGSTAPPATGAVSGPTSRSHSRSHTTRGTAGGGNGGNAGSGSKGGGTAQPDSPSHAKSPSGGGQSSEPVVSPTDVSHGAEAVSTVVSHVGEVFAEALPTKPLERIGAQVLAHTGIVPAKGGRAQKQALDRIGTALGAALIGSAVAVDRKPPAPSHDPLSFIVDPAGGSSGTLYVLGIFVVLLAAALIIGREVRKGFGFARPILGWIDGARDAWTNRRPGHFKAEARLLRARGVRVLRRLRSQAVSGLRSMF